MKKSILFVIDSLGSGGAEKSLVSLLSMLDYSKYDVDLLMFSPKGLYISLIPENVNIIETPEFLRNQRKGIKHLIQDKKLKELYFRVRIGIDIRKKHLKKKFHSAQITWKWMSKGINKLEKEYDVAIAYSQGMPTYYVSEKVVASKKLSWINTDYNKAAYNKEFDINYYEQFDDIVAVSDYGKKSILKKTPELAEKVTVIYDIISPKLIKNMAIENGGFDDQYKGIRILTIGRLVHLKGYDFAIQAAYKLKQEGINFRWYCIGEGELEINLKCMVNELELKEEFIFLGTNQNPYTYLKQSDIYVQPSRFEGFGLAIAEARLLEKPIVSTNFEIVHDQIINENNGLIVNMNVDDLYRGLLRLINDKQLRSILQYNLSKENIGTEDEIDKIYKLINK